MKRILLDLGLVLLICGCTTPSTQGTAWRSATTDSKSGKVVTMWIKRDQGDAPVVLTLDYGMLIVWGENERAFYLFNGKTKEMLGTTSFDAFLSELGGMRKNITLEWIDTCTTPRYWKMPKEAHERLAAVLTQGGRLIETPFRACYCESKGLKFLDAEPANPP